VTKAGTVLNSSGVLVATFASTPALVFDGTNYLAVWTDTRSAVGTIAGSRVSTAGTALDNPRIVISTAANAQMAPAVAFDGTNYLVVWVDNRAGGSTDIYAARLSPTGTILDGSGIPISVAPGDQTAPAVVFDGTNYLVAWVDGRSGTATDIFGSRVTKAGSVLDTTGIPISLGTGNQTAPALSSDGTNDLVVWQDFRAGVDPSIYGTRVTKTGTVLSGAGTPISTNVDSVTPALAFDGTNYLVVWSRSGAIDGTRVSKAGVVLDGSGIVISGPHLDQLPAIAFDGTNYLVVWQDLRSSNGYDIFGTRVSKAGTVLDGSGIAVATGAGDQDEPRVSANGSFLVVWRDERSAVDTDIRANRVSGAGTVLDGSGFVISGSANVETAPAPTAGAGDTFGVAYQRFASEPADHSHRVFLRNVAPK